MKPNTVIAYAAIAAVSGVLTSCSNAVMEPHYEQNPSPARKYVVTAKIAGAPGPFNYAMASVRYKIGPTQQCMPDAEPFSGHFPTPSRFDVSPSITMISPEEYRFEVYLDAVASKDYFGKGVCSWEIETVNLYVAASAEPKDRRFVASILGPGVKDQKTKVLYARRALYAMPAGQAHERFEDALALDPVTKLYGVDISNFFTITIQAKESGHDDQ